MTKPDPMADNKKAPEDGDLSSFGMLTSKADNAIIPPMAEDSLDDILLTVFGQGLLGATDEQAGDWLPITKAAINAYTTNKIIKRLDDILDAHLHGDYSYSGTEVREKLETWRAELKALNHRKER